MLRRAGLVVLAAVVLAVAVAALASATGRESDDRGIEVVKLHFKTVQGVEADLGDPGFGPGDRYTFLDHLFEKGEKVGELAGDCIVVDLDGDTGFTTQCQATASLPGGQIAAQGLLAIKNQRFQHFSLAVIGGTGDYRTVGGEIQVEEDSEEGKGTMAATLLR